MLAGKICYLEIPTTDAGLSADFYAKIFGWTIRGRGDGQRAFDDTTGSVSGSWIPGRPPMREPGMLTYIGVADIDATLREIANSGGTVVTQRTAIGPGMAFATFHDPMGNLLGIYQEPSGQEPGGKE